MRSVFALVALPLLLLFILDGSPLLPVISVAAFPANASMVSAALTPNKNFTTDGVVVAGDVTEYPVFISVTEETQTSPESEVVTETYMVVEDQEVDYDDDDSDTSTGSPAVVRSTTPMPSPKSSPEQEEVLRELKKLWDLSEGMSDNENDALKNSLSSIVHLAYARVYIEPDETLQKLKYLLQQLQTRILLGTNLNADESLSTTKTVASSSSSFSKEDAVKSNDSTSTSSPTNLGATTERSYKSQVKTRRKRSFYDGYVDDDRDGGDNIEAIFFANVNSAENSLLPEEKKKIQYQHEVQDAEQIQNSLAKTNLTKLNAVSATILIKNDSTIKDPLDRTLLSTGSFSSITSSVSTTTPTTLVQKVIHINDRQKPMSSFYLTPERIQELKSRVTSSTTTSTSTLSPLNIMIEDELENEVNMLQQQHQVDNYDIHISSSTETLVPLTTGTPPTSHFHKKPLSGGIATMATSTFSTTTEMPYTAEDIALALFQLLRPDTFEDDENEDENVTGLPHPKPSNILYQVGSLSSVLNFTIKPKNDSTSTTTTKATTTTTTTTTKAPLSTTIAPSSKRPNTTISFLKLKEKYATNNKTNVNATLPAPPALLDLVNSLKNLNSSAGMGTSTERQISPSPSNDVYDYTDVLDQTAVGAGNQESITSSIVQGTQEGVQQMMGAITRLSVGAKMVLLFSVSISVLSIGFGIFSLGPPLAGVGVLGIIIPVGLLLLFETAGASGKRKLTTRQREQLLINKLQSEEFSKVLDMIFDAVIKYSKG